MARHDGLFDSDSEGGRLNLFNGRLMSECAECDRNMMKSINAVQSAFFLNFYGEIILNFNYTMNNQSIIHQ